ncbi:M28 family peptidase [Nemorincola caseinilytica]|uniref:Carboxypeptidase Q n=1 Tax=Nemorincola caseinilytica TaxID=2054315 RepID=A0ABP8N641_9BACT
MKRTTLSIAICLAAMTGYGQTQDSIMFRRISDEILLHGTCYENLRVLCKTVGHRLSGTPAAAKAVTWGEKAMKEAGADKVWLQKVNVPYWYRGKESLELRLNGSYKKVPALSLGNSEGTGGKPMEAQVVMVGSFDEYKALPEKDVKGKIVFFNYRFRQDFVNSFDGYGDAVAYRWNSPNVAAKRGAAGVIIRSMSTGMDDHPHTGSMHYEDSLAVKLPEMAIGNETADALEAACKKGAVSARMTSECHMMKDMVPSFNVIGEIKGTEQPERIITVGGHLDSWDVGEGAHDDGAGCVQSIEVIRALKAIGYRPRYTIRAVLFMNEENGNKGGHAYADSAVARKEQHVVAFESDAGGFSPRGIGLEMSEAKKNHIRQYKHLFLPYNVYDFDHEEGGVDISPLYHKHKVPMAGLMPDSQRYFDVHHTPNDVFEQVNHRELKLGAAVMAQFVYLVCEHGLE